MPYTVFELLYLTLEPFLPPLQRKVRSELKVIAAQFGGVGEFLDVGGRMSHYTIGIDANVTVSDIPRESELQKRLDLGLTPDLIKRLRGRRSNVCRAIFDDMTHSRLPDSFFDCVIAIEVLEHVAEDDEFLAHVARILKPGRSFLMSTPNGEFVKNRNPDHRRHYTRDSLRVALERHFQAVRVEYAIANSYFYGKALRRWDCRHPIRTAVTMFSATVNSIFSSPRMLPNGNPRSHQLFAIGIKSA